MATIHLPRDFKESLKLLNAHRVEYRYALGDKVGISTNRIHARGPVGLDGLVIYKWKLLGKGQIVADYTGPNARKFTHKKLR